ncbi:hypothetical protein DICVIV_14091, partial [Dictyocaulus viviparus]
MCKIPKSQKSKMAKNEKAKTPKNPAPKDRFAPRLFLPGNYTLKLPKLAYVDESGGEIKFTIDNKGRAVFKDQNSKTLSSVSENGFLQIQIGERTVPTPPPGGSFTPGSNRYNTSAQVSSTAFQTANTAFLVSGESPADALSAGPAAIKENAPLLLTLPDRIPESIKNELLRLK